MSRRSCNSSGCRVTAALTVVLLLVSAAADASDEVDYSAPYLVVENGELVTKYPAREHAGSEETTGTAESRAPESASSGSRWWLLAMLSAAAGIGFVAQRQWRRHAMRKAAAGR